LAQGIAVLPGLSRSGITLATLLWLGIASERAFELSFLLSLPALTVGALLGARVALYRDDEGAILLYAAALVCVVGVGALEVLRGALLRRILWVFAVYLVPLGVATLAWGYARP
jgi:undecaprenyl-diphosphatase